MKSCVSTITAAIIAVNGTLTMPPEYRVPVVDAGGKPIISGVPTCAQLTVTGSIATHYGPFLIMSGIGGWSKRTTAWDPTLSYRPPPLTPVVSPWRTDSIETVDRDCFDTNGKLASIGCR